MPLSQSNISLKNFIYVDTEKVYSIASQLLGGVTETSRQEEGMALEESDSSKGKLLEGLSHTDTVMNSKNSTRVSTPHDYYISEFLKVLNENNKIYTIDESYCQGHAVGKLVKITAQVWFDDFNKIYEFAKNAGDLFGALGLMQFKERFSNIEEYLENTPKNSRNSDEYQIAKKIYNQRNNPKQLAKIFDPNLDEDNFKPMIPILDFAYSDFFRLRQSVGGLKILSFIDREFLRDNEHTLIRKLSRKSRIDLTVVGIITQDLLCENDARVNDEENSDDGDMMAKFEEMQSAMKEMEETFVNKKDNEIIVDPLIVYMDI